MNKEHERDDARSAGDLSDGDILEAMKDMEGYVDITPADLREIFRFAYRHAVKRLAQSVRARDIMTRPVHSVRDDAAVAEVARVMAGKRVSGVPVLDAGGRVVGVISEKDFLRRMGGEDRDHVMDIVAACLTGKGCMALPVRAQKAGDIMTAPAITVGEETTVSGIMELFTAKKINRVPVVNSSGTLAGIVSRADVIRIRPGQGA